MADCRFQELRLFHAGNGRIEATAQLKLDGLSKVTSSPKADFGIASVRQSLLLAVEAICQPPEFLAVRIDQDEQAAPVRALVGLLSAFERFQSDVRQHSVSPESRTN